MELWALRNNERSNWTKLTAQCYKRHCICRDCDLIPEDLIKECLVKNYVLINYRMHDKPQSAFILNKMEEV